MIVIDGTTIRSIGHDAPKAARVHGLNVREFAVMVKPGMSPIDAIHAVITPPPTSSASPTAARSGRAKLADLIAVRGNPLEDIRTLERVAFVMKGRVVFQAPTPPRR